MNKIKCIDTKKNILITGCSSGIGRFTALELHAAGFNVIASVRSAEQQSELRALGLKTVIIDLCDPESIDSGFNQAMTLFDGRLDCLFNNAAYGQPGAVEDITTETLRDQFEVNFFSWHDLTKRAVNIMRQQSEGRIIQNSSVLGLLAMPYRGAYNASKFAIEGLTDTLRLELYNTDIKVCLIEPGPINTHFRENALKAFLDRVDYNHSYHKKNYALELKRLQSDKSESTYALEVDAVYEKVYHAITAEKPKHRYYVTRLTYFAAWCKRLLPMTWIDRILLKGAS